MTRQNTSQACSPPSPAVVCTVYPMTRTVTGVPSFSRGGFSPARYLPSARTCTGLRVNDAEARHRRCAPAARKARAAAPDKNLRSASTTMPGPKQPSRPAASGCPAPVYQPIAAPSRLPVPDSAAATHRACGNAPSPDWLEGRPKNAAFLSLSGTSVTDPSLETTRSPQQNTPGAPSAPAGPATCPNNIRTGPAPSLPRPQDSEQMSGSHHWRPPPASTRPPGASRPASNPAPRRWQYSPSVSLAITCPYPQFRPRNSHNVRSIRGALPAFLLVGRPPDRLPNPACLLARHRALRESRYWRGWPLMPWSARGPGSLFPGSGSASGSASPG